MKEFVRINRAYNRVFQPQKLSVGIVVPIEQYSLSPVPSMKHHLERVRLVEALGFTAIWVRDIPLNVPAFGDAGQTYDPFTYLGFLAGQTSTIGLGVASIALPLHHPLHVAKSAATIDQLSDGRFLMGIASGDRQEEYPGLGFDYMQRGERFREAYTYIRKAQEPFPTLASSYGTLSGQADILPKPVGSHIPMLITGRSRQSMEWIAVHGDGWMSYPKNIGQQAFSIAQWRELMAAKQEPDKPFMQPLYIDLQADDDAKPMALPLGFRLGVNHLIDYFHLLQEIGVNHVAINLRVNASPIDQTLEHLAAKLLPHFQPSPLEINSL